MMVMRGIEHVYRSAPPVVQERHRRFRKQIAAELPELRRIGQASRGRAMSRQAMVQEVLDALRTRREAMGRSLMDVARRTGIDEANLSRLETGRSANSTLDTLQKYAQALGLELRIELVEPTEVRATKR
jgi:DNA-binding Xre family transcriptional regulator